MSFKDVLAPILSVDDDEAALAAAEVVGELSNAHLTALLLEIEPDPIYAASGEVISTVWADLVAKAEEQFKAEKKKLDARAVRGARPFATRELNVIPGFIDRDCGISARYADLTIMLRPQIVFR